ncbi:hypothetical protein [Streptomyces sp. NPDC006132]|uniref:hypothetical protein n=1 Tax=Streptomyces sp. NPDC006132 TaxID=3156732 RepID=UPI0034027FF2
MSSHVEEQIQARITAARAKAEADKRRRQELAEARQHGLAARHAQKLQRQDARRGADEDQADEQQDGDTADSPEPPAVDGRPANPTREGSR